MLKSKNVNDEISKDSPSAKTRKNIGMPCMLRFNTSTPTATCVARKRRAKYVYSINIGKILYNFSLKENNFQRHGKFKGQLCLNGWRSLEGDSNQVNPGKRLQKFPFSAKYLLMFRVKSIALLKRTYLLAATVQSKTRKLEIRGHFFHESANTDMFISACN